MKNIFIYIIILLLNSCSSKSSISKISVVHQINTTLDYEDGLRAKCTKESLNNYRYQNNNNYRMGWLNGDKNC